MVKRRACRYETRYGCKFSDMERKILDVLSDGEPHGQADLHSCIVGDNGAMVDIVVPKREQDPDLHRRLCSNIRTHISNIRKKIRSRNEDIVCVLGWGMSRNWMHVALLRPSRSSRIVV